MNQDHEVQKYVKDRYGRIATASESCCSCCGGPGTMEQAKSMGYTEKEICSLPPEALMGLGCGNPTALAELKEGETVLDLGCGGGLDVFLAAQRVGSSGRVIGIDMTPEMIAKAQENARQGDYGNVDFRLGEIESLPVENNSIDVIISNCVINLTTDKLAAYREAHRVLRPGGRILISDLVTEGTLPEDIRKSFEAWAECIAGAMEKGEYLQIIASAGFREVVVAAEKTYGEPGLDTRLAGKITSIQVKAFK